MSQKEFEQQEPLPEEEIYQPQYPYAWPDEAQQEGKPRDEPPIAYETQSSQSASQRTRVPSWARPQQNQHDTRTLLIAVIISLLLMLLLGVMGVVGLIIGIVG